MPNYFGGTSSVDFLQISLYQATLADAVAFAKTLPGIDAARIGLLGFSLGGHLCLRNRALTKVLVEFFAPELPELGGVGTAGNPTLHAQIHHGDKDGVVPLKLNAEPIEQKLRTEGADVTLFPYLGAGHGFNGKHPGDASAQQKSKERTLAFFEKIFDRVMAPKPSFLAHRLGWRSAETQLTKLQVLLGDYKCILRHHCWKSYTPV